jgi:hypothetical protein
MRFLSMIRIDEGAAQVPSEQLMHDMGKLIDEMTREGVLILTAGLRPSVEGRRVRLDKGAAVHGRRSVYGGQGSDRRIRHPRGAVHVVGD